MKEKKSLTKVSPQLLKELEMIEIHGGNAVSYGPRYKSNGATNTFCDKEKCICTNIYFNANTCRN